MRRKFIPFILLVSTIFAMSSCFSDDQNEIVLSDEVGITAFTLGTQKIVYDTISSKGEDSTYQTTLDCSKYIFYIDQSKHEIYNPDSLPVGIDAKKIICSVMARNGSLPLIKNMDSDTINIFSSSDSIDFSKPRTFRVVSLSGRASYDYTVKINIHKEKPNVFEWKQATENRAVAGLTGFRAFALDGKVYIMGSDGSGARIYKADEGNVVTWTEVTPTTALGNNFYKNIAIMGNRFYTYADDGSVYCSTDAETWTKVAQVGLERILGASNKRIYALTADRKLTSTADGVTWIELQMDTHTDSLPSDNYNIIARPLVTNPKANRVVLVGTSATTSRVWSNIEETDDQSEPQPWTYLDVANDNRFRLPNMVNLQVTYYDNFMMALGGTGMGNSKTEAFSGFYISLDGGMTWRIRTLYDLPEDFGSDSGRFAFVKDSINYLWVIESTGKVWRGRLNRLGWHTDDSFFGE